LTRELVYGRRPAREVIRAGRRQILELYATERALGSEPWLRDETGLRIHVEREGRLNELAGSRDHQGVVALCEPYRYADAYELAAGEQPLIACLDQVTDPHNLGAVCRSADGAGATGVVVTEHKAARVTPAVCRASAGAVEHVQIALVPGLPATLSRLRDLGIWVVGLDDAAERSLFDIADLAVEGICIVLGAEGAGLSRLVRERCDLLVAIPMGGRISSLNVAAAAALATYEVARHRR